MNNLFNQVNVFGDLCTNHYGDKVLASELIGICIRNGVIPKIQLFDEYTWNPDWMDLVANTNFAASVFIPEDVDFIMRFNPIALKVASIEATFYGLIHRCLQEDVPLIVSTGGMNESELDMLIYTLAKSDKDPNDICLMHCVSQYPTITANANIMRIDTIFEILDNYNLDFHVGFSSHMVEQCNIAVTAAYTLGATQFEFHVRGDVTEVAPSSDELSSLFEPDIRSLMRTLQATQIVLGTGEIEGVDREDVLKWRDRWQEPTALDELDDEDLLED